MGLATSLLGEGLAEPRSGSGESEHSLDVESGGGEMPLADDAMEAAQQELPKADRRFDDAEDRFGYLLALCVEPFPSGVAKLWRMMSSGVIVSGSFSAGGAAAKRWRQDG
jgi:hypothetical protein